MRRLVPLSLLAALALAGPALADTAGPRLELAEPGLALAALRVPQLQAESTLAAAPALPPVLAQAEPSLVLPASPFTDADPLWARLLLQALSLVAAGLVVVAPLFLGQRARHRLGLLEHWSRVAFTATQEAVRLTPTLADNKAHYALGVFVRGLQSAGIRPTEQEADAARLMWQALNEEQHMADVAAGLKPGALGTAAALSGVAREVHTPDPLTARAG